VSAGAFAQIAGWSARGTDIPAPLAWLAIAAGIGFVAVSCGFIARDQSHPLAVVGGGVVFVGSLAFQFWIGFLLLTGRLTIPEWNA
jgi:hypothetical protein